MTTARSPIPFSSAELHRRRRASSYDGAALRGLAYPVGALGSGGCRLHGDGRLADWRLDGSGAPAPAALAVSFRVGVRRGARGRRRELAIADAVERLVVAFPLATLQLDLPDLDARLDVFSAFLPLDHAASGLPVIQLVLQLTNCSDRSLVIDWQALLAAPAGSSLCADSDTALGSGLRLGLPGVCLALIAPGLAAAEPDAETGCLSLSTRLAPKAETSLRLAVVWAADPAALQATLADLADRLPDLEAETRSFSRALNSASVPDILREAVGAQLAELCAAPAAAIAESTALPYFFPRLARRLHDHQGTSQTVDQQLASILRLYGDWMLCGDDDYLQARWPDLTSTLEGVARLWDPDYHGVLNGAEPTACSSDPSRAYPTINGLYLAALRAAEEMALQLDDTALAARYRKAFDQGRSWMEAVMFGGEFFRGSAESIASQASGPCLADQLLGQAYAGQWKLGHLLEPEMVQESLESIFAYNWQGGDPRAGTPGGICLCAYPHGGAPPDSAQSPDCRVGSWPGAEYAFAGLLVQEGMIDEGLAVVKAARDRCDGIHGHPWDSAAAADPAGVRPLAPYGVMLALMDFFYSAPARAIHFAPRLYRDDFACIFAVDRAWGLLHQKQTPEGARIDVEILGGTLVLDSLSTGLPAHHATLHHAGREIAGKGETHLFGTIIRFADALAIGPGESLAVTLSIGDWDSLDDPLDDAPLDRDGDSDAI